MESTNIQHIDRETIQLCVQGDRHAFKALYDMYKDRVFSTIIRMLGNMQDAEDTLQEVFVKIHRNIGKFKWQSSFSTWIYRIAVNTCIEHIRKNKKSENRVDIDVHTDEIPAYLADKSTDNFRLIVENELDNLPEGYKTVFILHAIEGFKHREIADILDISSGTSKSQYYQARTRLRENLLPYLEVLKYEL